MKNGTNYLSVSVFPAIQDIFSFKAKLESTDGPWIDVQLDFCKKQGKSETLK